MAAIWLKHPDAILADDAGGGIVVASGRIVELVPAGARPAHPSDAAEDLRGTVLLPGLVDGHHHGWQHVARMAGGEPTLDDLRRAYRLAFALALRRGCTTLVEHQEFYPPTWRCAGDVAVEVARELGLRLVLARGGVDRGGDDGGRAPAWMVETAETILADAARLIARYHQAGRDDALCQVMLAPNQPAEVSRWLLEEAAALASLHEVRLQTHLAASDEAVDRCRAHFGCRPVDVLEAAGWLGPRTTLVDARRLTLAEIARLAQHGVAVVQCPAAEGADGASPTPVQELTAAGIAVGLGSAAGGNVAADVRLAELALRVRGSERARSSSAAALAAATVGGAATLGRSDLGTIAVGQAADLVAYPTDPLQPWLGADPAAVLAGPDAPRAERVMVAGRWVVRDGAVLGLDPTALRPAPAAAGGCRLAG